MALTFAIVAACTSDDEATATQTPDAATNVRPDGSPGYDSSVDPVKDGGADSADSASVDAADAYVPPPLCQVYPNVSADASAAEGPRKLYELIAVRSLLEAVDSCEIGSAFPDLEDPPPSQITCFGKQLASVAGCLSGGAPIDYAIQLDENGASCIAATTGDDTVQLGFRNPATSGYSKMDVDFLIGLVRKAALSTGMPAADADRLKALLIAQRTKAASDAGGANYTQSTCP